MATPRVVFFGAGASTGPLCRVLARQGIAPAAFFSPTPARAELAAGRWGGWPFSEWRRLLDDVQADAAFVCLPPGAPARLEILEELFGRALPVFTEKPVAAGEAAARRLDAALQAAPDPPPVQVGYQLRGLDPLPETYGLLAGAGPLHITANWLGRLPPVPWWIRRELSGGPWQEQFTHLADLVFLLLGHTFTVTHAWSQRLPIPGADIPGRSGVSLAWPEGSTGVFAHSCMLPHTLDISVTILGDGLEVKVTPTSVMVDRGGVPAARWRLPEPDYLVDKEVAAFLATLDGAEPACSWRSALATHRSSITLDRAIRAKEHWQR
jgi:predicted dehydrogenase